MRHEEGDWIEIGFVHMIFFLPHLFQLRFAARMVDFLMIIVERLLLLQVFLVLLAMLFVQLAYFFLLFEFLLQLVFLHRDDHCNHSMQTIVSVSKMTELTLNSLRLCSSASAKSLDVFKISFFKSSISNVCSFSWSMCSCSSIFKWSRSISFVNSY